MTICAWTSKFLIKELVMWRKCSSLSESWSSWDDLAFQMAVVIDEADGNNDYCQRVRSYPFRRQPGLLWVHRWPFESKQWLPFAFTVNNKHSIWFLLQNLFFPCDFSWRVWLYTGLLRQNNITVFKMESPIIHSEQFIILTWTDVSYIN